MQTSMMGESERRRAGMAAFRAKMLRAHEAMLAGSDPNTLKRGAAGSAARKYHSDMIASIKAAQLRFGEAAE